MSLVLVFVLSDVLVLLSSQVRLVLPMHQAVIRSMLHRLESVIHFHFMGVISLVDFFTLIGGIVIHVFVVILDILLNGFIIDHSFDLVIKWLEVWVRGAVVMSMTVLKG